MCVCVRVHVAFTYMHIHDCTFTEIHSGREGEGEEEGMIVREMKRGKEREGYTRIISF